MVQNARYPRTLARTFAEVSPSGSDHSIRMSADRWFDDGCHHGIAENQACERQKPVTRHQRLPQASSLVNVFHAANARSPSGVTR